MFLFFLIISTWYNYDVLYSHPGLSKPLHLEVRLKVSTDEVEGIMPASSKLWAWKLWLGFTREGVTNNFTVCFLLRITLDDVTLFPALCHENCAIFKTASAIWQITTITKTKGVTTIIKLPRYEMYLTVFGFSFGYINKFPIIGITQ